MKSTPTFLKFCLPVILCLGAAQSVQAQPWMSLSSDHSVGYSQTTSGTTSLDRYGVNLFVSLGNYGNFDPNAYFPTSVSIAGTPIFPGGQLDLGIDYSGATTAIIQGPTYYGTAGGGIFSPPPTANGYMFAGAGAWSPNFSDVQGPLSVTFHGGDFDGFVQTGGAFDINLLPAAPLFTAASLAALGNIAGNQDIALTLVQPFFQGISASYVISEIVNGQYLTLTQVNLDPILNPTGFNVSGSLFLSGHDYSLTVNSVTATYTGSSSTSYQSSNSVIFSVLPTSVPDQGATLALFGASLLGLTLLRRRLAA